MEKSPYNSLKDELLEMERTDQEMRIKSQNDMSAWDDSIDHHNTERLKQIIQETGWPTISTVGADASHAAWLLVQHAYADPAFMQHCLQLMKKAGEGEVAAANIAYLQDRLLIIEDKPQVYGTQFRKSENGWEPFPIQDPENVDARRMSVGLDTLAENQANINALYTP